VLSVFFGFGLVLLTFVQRQPTRAGRALDVPVRPGRHAGHRGRHHLIAVLGGVALLVVTLAWKEFKLLAFDREFGASLGLPMRGVECC
jgi:manganese/zinc/iron transport system permease protein